MKIIAHDAYRTFDYVQVVNRVFDLMVSNGLEQQTLAKQLHLSDAVIGKFFQYKVVSMPTLLILSEWACINLAYFIIKQD